MRSRFALYDDDVEWLETLGGEGSGNFGHAGRPGKIGGSAHSDDPERASSNYGSIAFQEGVGAVTFFHGTSSAMLRSIKRQGLRPSGGRGADAWLIKEGVVTIEDEDAAEDRDGNVVLNERHVFVSEDLAVAQRFAKLAVEMNPGSEPVVLAVTVPEGRDTTYDDERGVGLSRMSRDPQADPGYAAWRINGKVPPTWIDVVSPSGELRALASPTFYVVLMVRPELRDLGGEGSGNFGHAGRPGEVGGSAESFASFERTALKNLSVTSRTITGVSDTSSSADKPKLVVEGRELIAKVERNVTRALRVVWDERHRDFAGPEDLRNFADRVAATVNDGLLQPGQSIYRTWETNVPAANGGRQAAPSEIEPKYAALMRNLYDRLEAREDPIETAAWLEKAITIPHPWADGVGRTTKLLSAFILARGGERLPEYPDRQTYYKHLESSDWPTYYRSLFGKLRAAGGPGSGNFGHAGRPGEIGGSASASWKSDRLASIPKVLYRNTEPGSFATTAREYYGGELGGGIYFNANEEAAVAYAGAAYVKGRLVMPKRSVHYVEWAQEPRENEVAYATGEGDVARMIRGDDVEIWKYNAAKDWKQNRADMYAAAHANGVKVVIGLSDHDGGGQIAVLDNTLIKLIKTVEVGS